MIKSLIGWAVRTSDIHGLTFPFPVPWRREPNDSCWIASPLGFVEGPGLLRASSARVQGHRHRTQPETDEAMLLRFC